MFKCIEALANHGIARLCSVPRCSGRPIIRKTTFSRKEKALEHNYSSLFIGSLNRDLCGELVAVVVVVMVVEN